jgi:uncharacterized membrane protein YfcA/uncharacterized protein YjiS (DUF1127 family)
VTTWDKIGKQSLGPGMPSLARGIESVRPFLGSLTHLGRVWGRMRRDRLELAKMSDLDVKDIGFPPELPVCAGISAAPSFIAKLCIVLAFIVFAALAALDVLQHVDADAVRDLLTSTSLATVVGVLGSLVIAGIVKGAIGVGMPIVGFPLLTAFVNVQTAVILLTVPLTLSNIPQALEGKGTGRVLKQLLPIFVGTVPGLLIGVHLLVTVDPRYAQIIAGAGLTFVVILMLCAPKLSVSPQADGPASLVVGVASGVLGGIAAVSGPLVFSFLLAKGLRGKSFTKHASTYLVISSILLGLTLAANRSFALGDLMISCAALAPVALGMVFGQYVRDRISTDRFKIAVLAVVLLSGLDLVRRGAGY